MSHCFLPDTSQSQIAWELQDGRVEHIDFDDDIPHQDLMAALKVAVRIGE